MTITSGGKTLTVKDVLVGEVWLCSGQSNMEWPVERADNAAQEIAQANWPLIRHIKAPRDPQPLPQDDTKAAWEVCSPETVKSFSAVGYYFGRRLHQELDVPVGLINCSWGGTRIEPWTPLNGFAAVPQLKSLYQTVLAKQPSSDSYRKIASDYIADMEKWLAQAQKSYASEGALPPSPVFPDAIKPYTDRQDPTTLYNGMMSPFVPFGINGSIWYQGEANRGDGMEYFYKTKALLDGWRQNWERPELPYYYVQIAPYKGYSGDANILPLFWEAQAAIEKQIPNTGMVVVSDIGNIDNIHPTNKQDVGLRLANMALKRQFGRTDLIDMGPRFADIAIKDGKVFLRFDHVADGLKSRDGKPLNEFQITGPGQNWTTATARIVSADTIELSSPEVPNPSAARFGWNKIGTPNLMNSAGLPAAPFRAGDEPDPLSVRPNPADLEGYELVYEMDLTKLAPKIQYGVDRHNELTGSFDRVAYLVEMGKSPESSQWVLVSMDAFTKDISKIGIPALDSKASFQQAVSNLSVRSNVAGVPTGDGFKGNLEFWPNNYSPVNSANIPGASNDRFDNGDRPDGSRPDGYGSMQVHLSDPVFTVFALNSWKNGNNADLGIGTNTASGQHADWTFTKSASQYPYKQLKVLVRPK
nr:sialate O-acetylesterase [Ruficoccus amylovorans]